MGWSAVQFTGTLIEGEFVWLARIGVICAMAAPLAIWAATCAHMFGLCNRR